jgi:hypothetical protein
MRRIWIFSSYLGPDFPTRTAEECGAFADAVRDIQQGISGTCSDPPENDQAARTIHAPDDSALAPPPEGDGQAAGKPEDPEALVGLRCPVCGDTYSISFRDDRGDLHVTCAKCRRRMPIRVEVPRAPASSPASSPRGDEPAAATASGTTARQPKKEPAGGTGVSPRGNRQAAGSNGSNQRDDGKDTNTRVKEELNRNPDASSFDIQKATGIPNQTVRRSKAWRDHQEARTQHKSKSADALDHARPLTAPMLNAIDSHAADPATVAAEREGQIDFEAIEPPDLLRRCYLEGATADERARFNRLNPADQESELQAWKWSGIRLAE